MIRGEVETDIELEITLSDGDTGKFPQAKVYDKTEILIATINLTHVADGHYHGTFLGTDNTALGHLSANFIVYQDAGHTIVANKYDRVAEHLLVESPVGGAA